MFGLDSWHHDAIQGSIFAVMWKSRDPLPTFTTYLEHMNVLTSEKEHDIDQRIKEVLDDAVRFAEDSPDPAPEDAVTDLYA